MTAKPAPLPPRAVWSLWADRAIARGRSDAGRAARFLDDADPTAPDLKGLSPDDRAAISRRLHLAAKGA